MKKYLLIVLVVLIVLAGVSWGFYKLPDSRIRDIIAQILPYPAATVGGHPILAKDLLRRTQVAETVFKNDRENLDIRSLVFNRLVEEKKAEIIASKYGIVISDKDLAAQMDLFKNQANQQSP